MSEEQVINTSSSEAISGNVEPHQTNNGNEEKHYFDTNKFKEHFVKAPKLKKPQVMNHFVKGGGDMGNFQGIYKDIKSERLSQRKQAYQKAKESAPPKDKSSKSYSGGKIKVKSRITKA